MLKIIPSSLSIATPVVGIEFLEERPEFLEEHLVNYDTFKQELLFDEENPSDCLLIDLKGKCQTDTENGVLRSSPDSNTGFNLKSGVAQQRSDPNQEVTTGPDNLDTKRVEAKGVSKNSRKKSKKAGKQSKNSRRRARKSGGASRISPSNFDELVRRSKEVERCGGAKEVPKLKGVDVRLGWATSYGYASDKALWKALLVLLFGTDGFNPKHGLHERMVDGKVFENRIATTKGICLLWNEEPSKYEHGDTQYHFHIRLTGTWFDFHKLWVQYYTCQFLRRHYRCDFSRTDINITMPEEMYPVREIQKALHDKQFKGFLKRTLIYSFDIDETLLWTFYRGTRQSDFLGRAYQTRAKHGFDAVRDEGQMHDLVADAFWLQCDALEAEMGFDSLAKFGNSHKAKKRFLNKLQDMITGIILSRQSYVDRSMMYSNGTLKKGATFDWWTDYCKRLGGAVKLETIPKPEKKLKRSFRAFMKQWGGYIVLFAKAFSPEEFAQMIDHIVRERSQSDTAKNLEFLTELFKDKLSALGIEDPPPNFALG